MKKKISIEIDDEKTIKKLVDSVKDAQSIASNYGQAINAIRKIVLDELTKEQVSEKINMFTTADYWERINYARQIVLMLMGLAVKNCISEERYKDIILKVLPGNMELATSCKQTLGTNYQNEENKNVNTMTLCAIEYLASGNILEFSRSLSTFAHEIYHTKQKFSLESGEFSISNLINALERVAYANKDEYDKNYNHIFFETEADYNGLTLSADMFRLLAVKKENFNKFDKDKYIELLMGRKANWKNMLFDFDTQCNYVKELIEKLKKDNRTITPNLLDRFPVLRTIYQQDGSLQNSNVIIPRLKRLLTNDATNDLNNFINLLIIVHQDTKVSSPQHK